MKHRKKATNLIFKLKTYRSTDRSAIFEYEGALFKDRHKAVKYAAHTFIINHPTYQNVENKRADEAKMMWMMRNPDVAIEVLRAVDFYTNLPAIMEGEDGAR